MAESINLTSHVLVPKHRVLSEEESKNLLDKYNISKIQLPEIVSKDPIVVALKAKVDDIIEIKRTSVTNKELYYRRVVK